MPVTTRSRGAPPISRSVMATRLSPDFGSDDAYMSDTPVPEDDDGDWGVKHKRGKDGRPQKKRVRRSGKAKQSQRTRPKGIAKVCVLPTLPLDVLFEILELLTPLDLANLAQINQAFRTTLLSPQSVAIWKASRQQAGGAPDCPTQVPEVYWARLLFGAARCQECNTLNVYKIDFALLRRICTHCKKTKLVCSKHFNKMFPDFHPGVMELILHTDIGGWAHGHSSTSKFYWTPDIYAMSQKYGEFQRDIYLRKPGASEALQRFKDERVSYVQSIVEHAKKCQTWRDSWERDQFTERMQRRRQRYDKVAQRFRDLGYEPSDIDAIGGRSEVYRLTALTEAAWRRIRPRLEPLVASARRSRLATEQADLINARQQLVKNSYSNYKRTLRPIQWICLPLPEVVYQMSIIDPLIYSDLDVPLTQQACDEAVQKLPKILSAVVDELKVTLLHIMETKRTHYAVAAISKRQSTNPSDEAIARLNLVTSVFYAMDVEFLCSLEDVLAYIGNHDHSSSSDIWLQPTSIAAWKTIQAGLDVENTRPDDLDRLDKRFLCERCLPSPLHATPRKLAYSWRACMSHHLDAHRWSPDDPQFVALSDEAAAAVRASEGPDAAAEQVMWSCNNCTVHLDNWQKRQVVVDHVRETHKLEDPRENVDFFHAFPAQRVHSSPKYVSLNVANAVACSIA